MWHFFDRPTDIATLVAAHECYWNLVSYPDPNVRKHYRLQYNTAYIGSGQQVEESCSWNVIGMFDNLGCHSNGTSRAGLEYFVMSPSILKWLYLRFRHVSIYHNLSRARTIKHQARLCSVTSIDLLVNPLYVYCDNYRYVHLGLGTRLTRSYFLRLSVRIHIVIMLTYFWV